jgi:hypothetical protein
MQAQTPRTEVLDEVKEAQLEVVRDVVGRPLFLTARRFIRICRHIEQGESISEACRLELVHYTGFRRHVKANPKYQKRLKEAEETREEFLREYHIANIRKHAPRNVLASLWWLERRFPNQFALKPVRRSEGSGEQPIGDRIDENQLRRYSELMDQFRRENEAKTQSLAAPETAAQDAVVRIEVRIRPYRNRLHGNKSW